MSNAQKLSYALFDYYCLCYKNKYGIDPVVNRYRDRWGFQDMAESMQLEDCKRVIQYYFKTSSPGHKVRDLFSNFDHLLESLREVERDRERRLAIRKNTAKIVEEWQENNEH